MHQVVVPFTHQNAIVSRTTKYLVTAAVCRGASVASACTDREVGVILAYGGGASLSIPSMFECIHVYSDSCYARAHGAW